MDDKAIKTQKVAEMAMSSFLIVFSMVMLYFAYTAPLPRSAGKAGITLMTVPKGVLAVLLILSAVQFFRSAKWFTANRRPEIKVRFLEGKSAVTLLALFAYAFLWKEIGFFISSFIVFVFTVRYLEPERDLKQTILFGILFLVVIEVLFGYLFGITLAEPLLDAFRRS